MATTTNYGWTTPDNTDLVKDGAAAIRTLGSSIDTSMNAALGTKKAGMVLLNTTSFSGVASQSINDVFSATYTNYRIIINVQSATSQNEFLFRMRVAGSDDSTSNYHSQLITGNNTSVAGERVSSATSGTLAQMTNNVSGVDAVFYKPFDTVRTIVTATSANSLDTIRMRTIGSVLATSTSYTGFTIFGSTQNITGSVSVYGLAI